MPQRRVGSNERRGARRAAHRSRPCRGRRPSPQRCAAAVVAVNSSGRCLVQRALLGRPCHGASCTAGCVPLHWGSGKAALREGCGDNETAGCGACAGSWAAAPNGKQQFGEQRVVGIGEWARPRTDRRRSCGPRAQVKRRRGRDQRSGPPLSRVVAAGRPRSPRRVKCAAGEDRCGWRQVGWKFHGRMLLGGVETTGAAAGFVICGSSAQVGASPASGGAARGGVGGAAQAAALFAGFHVQGRHIIAIA